MLGRILDVGTKQAWKDEARSRMGRRRESGVEIQAPRVSQDPVNACSSVVGCSRGMQLNGKRKLSSWERTNDDIGQRPGEESG